MDKGPIDSDMEVHDEKEEAYLRALEGHGISIIGGERSELHETGSDQKPLDQFSRELMDEGGIEIVADDEGEEEESFL